MYCLGCGHSLRYVNFSDVQSRLTLKEYLYFSVVAKALNTWFVIILLADFTKQLKAAVV